MVAAPVGRVNDCWQRGDRRRDRRQAITWSAGRGSGLWSIWIAARWQRS